MESGEPLQLWLFVHDAHLVRAQMNVPGTCVLELTSGFISYHHSMDPETIYRIRLDGVTVAEIEAYKHTIRWKSVEELPPNPTEDDYKEETLLQEMRTPQEFQDAISPQAEWEVMSGELAAVDGTTVLSLYAITMIGSQPDFDVKLTAKSIEFEIEGSGPVPIEKLLAMGKAYWDDWKAKADADRAARRAAEQSNSE